MISNYRQALVEIAEGRTETFGLTPREYAQRFLAIAESTPLEDLAAHIVDQVVVSLKAELARLEQENAAWHARNENQAAALQTMREKMAHLTQERDRLLREE